MQHGGTDSTTQAVRSLHTFWDGVGGTQAATETAHASQVARAAVEVCLSPEPVLQVGHHQAREETSAVGIAGPCQPSSPALYTAAIIARDTQPGACTAIPCQPCSALLPCSCESMTSL